MPHRLRLLGRPRRGRVVLGAGRTALLLYYLAYHGTWLGRDEVASLFWPEVDEGKARRNLRQLIHRLKRTRYCAPLEVEPERLRLLIPTDVASFREALRGGRWAEAVYHYTGPFLDGIAVREAPGYEAWRGLERDRLHTRWREAALQHANELGHAERHGEAAALLRELWQSDQLDETVLRAYMRSASMEGGREQALLAFGSFERLLRDELGLAPLEETVELAATIRAGTAVGTRDPAPQTRAPFPAPDTPFLGRASELAEIGALLDRDDCRMLVIVGPGGVGKTRLALEVAGACGGRYRHGGYFVTLADVAGDEGVTAAVADSLGLTFDRNREPETQVVDYLRGKEALLVVDGIEHLIASSALFADILTEAPGLQILLTSREQLAITGAWHITLTGLSYPPTVASQEELVASDAARLFLQAATRTMPRFALAAGEEQYLLELCRLTEGLPLALEMAAAWVRNLSLREIVEDLRQSLELLSSAGTAGEQKRSVHAVFEHSWRLLSPVEQEVLAGLSVFRGGFERKAAQRVAAASLYVLLSLVGKSLLHKARSGRFDMHNLIRHYAALKLAERGGGAAIEARHAGYYADLTSRTWERMERGDEKGWLAHTSQEFGNTRAMWGWAVRQRSEGIVSATARQLAAFCSLRSRYREGLALFEEAEREFTEPSLVRAKVLGRMGNLALRQRGSPAARAHLEEALHILERCQDWFELAYVQMNLAGVARADGDLDEAERRFRTSHEIFERLDHRKAVGHALFNLGSVAHLRGNLQEARRRFEESLMTAGETGDMFAGGYVRMRLADICLELGEGEQAAGLYGESLSFFRDLGHRTGSAGAYLGLARLAIEDGAPQKATELLQDALAIYEETGNRSGSTEALVYLSRAARERDDRQCALDLAARALRAAEETASTPLILQALGALCNLAEAQEPALLACLLYIADHPAGTARLAKDLEPLARGLERELPEKLVEEARRLAKGLTLPEVTVRLGNYAL